MPIDPNIPLSAQPTTRVKSPAELMGIVLALQRDQQKQQAGALELQEKKRAMAVEDAYNNAVSNSLRPDGLIDMDRFGQAVAGTPAASKFPAVSKIMAEMQEQQGKVLEYRDKAAKAEADFAGSLANASDTYDDPFDKAAVLTAGLASGNKSGIIPTDHVKSILSGFLDETGKPDPAKVVATIKQLRAASEEQRKLGAEEATASSRTLGADVARERAIAQIPGLKAESEIKQQEAATMQGGISAEKRADQALRAREINIQAGHLAVAKDRLNKEAAVPDLTPAGKDAVALAFAKTGQMPPMGMGTKAANLRVEIINRAAELQPNLDLASSKADFAANAGSLKAVQQQRDAVVSFENTANANLDRFLETAKGVVDSGSPLINRSLRTIGRDVMGSQNQAAFDAARLVAQNEIAKVTSNPNLTGQLSDAARKEVEAAMSPNATLSQIYAVAKVLRADMASRHEALDQQITAIQGRIKEPSQAAPATPAIRRFNPATGKLE